MDGCAFREQTPLPFFIDWFHQIKTFSCLFPELMGLHLELQPCCVGTSYEVVTGSAVASTVGQLVTRSSGGHRSYLVPVSSTLFSRVTLGQGSTLGFSVSKPITMCMVGVALTELLRGPGHWMSPWVGKTGLVPRLGRDGTNPLGCFRFHSHDWGLQTWLWRYRYGWICLHHVPG